MLVTVTARFAPYDGPEKCRVGSIYEGARCGKRAEVVTIYEGSNGWKYETAPRCLADAEALRWDVPDAE